MKTIDEYLQQLEENLVFSEVQAPPNTKVVFMKTGIKDEERGNLISLATPDKLVGLFKQALNEQREEFRQIINEIIGEDEDVSLKDLNPVEHNMELNQVHRLGRNELRAEQRQRTTQLIPPQEKEG